MGSLFAYSILVSIPLVILFVTYKFTLANTTHHHFNRITVLSIYMTSLLAFPAIVALIPSLHSIENTSVELGQITMLITETETANYNTFPILLYIYATGVTIFLSKLIVAIIRISLLSIHSKRVTYSNQTILLHNHHNIVPFSWGNRIYIGLHDFDEDKSLIVAHELAHLKARHWIDLLIAQSAIIINWFNPVAWLLRHELQNIHEFEADANVLKNNNINSTQYQLFLIKKTAGRRFAAIANSLNHSSLKKRITMMLSKKSRSKSRMRVLALVPAAALAMVFVNNPAVASTLSTVSSTDMATVFPDKDSEKSPLNVAEKMPQFPGGMSELMKYISQNIHYPQSALDNKVEGRVVVQFVISETGKVSDPHVMRGVEASLDAEAVRVISTLPDFIPGEIGGKKVAVRYALPVTFKLHQNESNDNSVTEIPSTNKKSTPLYVVDGKVLNGDISSISPNDIKSMEIIKNEDATSRYGERGANGVIIITTKD